MGNQTVSHFFIIVLQNGYFFIQLCYDPETLSCRNYFYHGFGAGVVFAGDKFIFAAGDGCLAHRSFIFQSVDRPDRPIQPGRLFHPDKKTKKSRAAAIFKDLISAGDAAGGVARRVIIFADIPRFLVGVGLNFADVGSGSGILFITQARIGKFWLY